MFKKNKKQIETIKEQKKKRYVLSRKAYIKNRDCVVGGAYQKRELWSVYEFYGYRPAYHL